MLKKEGYYNKEQTMQSVTNPFQALSDIFYRPSAVFNALAEKDNWSWIPFILIVIFSCLPAYMYYGFVDITWYQEAVLAGQAEEMSPAELDLAKSQMTQSVLQISSLVMGVLGPVIFTAIAAAYLTLVGKSDEESVHGFTDWYGFAWWTALPTIISSLVALALIATAANHEIPQTIIAPTSMAYLLSIPMSSEWVNFASFLRLDSIWSIVLTGIGIASWTTIPKAKAFLFAAAPQIVIGVVWLAIKLV